MHVASRNAYNLKIGEDFPNGKRSTFYEGKAKQIYATDEEELFGLNIRILQLLLMVRRKLKCWKRSLNNEITVFNFQKLKETG